MTEIRIAAPGDATALSALHHLVFETSVWDATFWRDAATDPNSFVSIAVSSKLDTVLGLIALRRVLDEAEVLTLAVDPRFRRQGIARTLVREGLGAMGEAGVARVFLEVAEDNPGALALYERAGFAPCGARENYYGSGRSAVLMEKRSALAPAGGAP